MYQNEIERKPATTLKQTDRFLHKQRKREGGGGREGGRERETHTHRDTDQQTDTDRQTETDTDRQKQGQTDRETDRRTTDRDVWSSWCLGIFHTFILCGGWWLFQ